MDLQKYLITLNIMKKIFLYDKFASLLYTGKYDILGIFVRGYNYHYFLKII